MKHHDSCNLQDTAYVINVNKSTFQWNVCRVSNFISLFETKAGLTRVTFCLLERLNWPFSLELKSTIPFEAKQIELSRKLNIAFTAKWQITRPIYLRKSNTSDSFLKEYRLVSTIEPVIQLRFLRLDRNLIGTCY